MGGYAKGPGLNALFEFGCSRSARPAPWYLHVSLPMNSLVSFRTPAVSNSIEATFLHNGSMIRIETLEHWDVVTFTLTARLQELSAGSKLSRLKLERFVCPTPKGRQ